MEFSHSTTHTCNSATIILLLWSTFLLSNSFFSILNQWCNQYWSKHWQFICLLRAHHTTWPANNCLQLSLFQQIIFCSCVTETTLLCEKGRSVPEQVESDLTYFSWSKEQWLNDKTIAELSYRKTLCFVSVSRINYLLQPSAFANNNYYWSAHQWQITIFGSTSLNNCYMFQPASLTRKLSMINNLTIKPLGSQKERNFSLST